MRQNNMAKYIIVLITSAFFSQFLAAGNDYDKFDRWGVSLIEALDSGEATLRNDYAEAAYGKEWDFKHGYPQNFETGPGLKNVRIEDGKLKFTTSASGNWLRWNGEKIGFNWCSGEAFWYRYYCVVDIKQTLAKSSWKTYTVANPGNNEQAISQPAELKEPEGEQTCPK